MNLFPKFLFLKKRLKKNKCLSKTETTTAIECHPTHNKSLGCNLIGHIYAPSGRGEDIRTAAMAAKTSDLPFNLVNTFGDYGNDGKGLAHNSILREKISTKNPYDVNIYFINADEMQHAYNHLGPDFYTNKYNIGCWAWELREFPDAWLPALDLVDEIWAPSRYIQDAIAQKTDKPVIYMPLAVDYCIEKALPRKRYKIPANKFLFLTFFDFTSYFQRKNPFAVIKAFNKFLQNLPERKNFVLVIKLNNWDHDDQHFDIFMSMVANNKQIMVIKEVLTEIEMKSLVANCDCLVSLHRSEGFGRGPAEAMSLGKPVIVTGYSGNMDYCNESNSFLVDYQLIDVKPDEYPYGVGQKWADADIEHATQCMKEAALNPIITKQKSTCAREYITAFQSPEYVGQRYKRRLKQLAKILQPTSSPSSRLILNT